MSKATKKSVKPEDITEDEQQKIDVDDADSVEEAKIYKKRQLMHKWKLGSHYRMERFSVMFGSLMAVLLIFTMVGFTNHSIATRDQVGHQAVYTEAIDFSLSGQVGKILNVYRDTNGKRAYVLISMEDVSKLSVDAEQYELFLTGADKKLKSTPEATFFMFGSSGYMGIELYDEAGLPNQVLNFTLRANSDLYDSGEDMTEEQLAEMDDASFGRNDQAQFFANVGAADAVELSALDTKLEPVELYYALVGHVDEDLIFDQIDEHTKELGRLLALNDEYTNRLVELGFEAPATPAFMDGDYVDDEGFFNSRQDVIGHHEIEYKDTRVTDGFVLQVVNDVPDFRDYMAKKRADAQLAQSNSEDLTEAIPEITSVTRNDGYELPIAEISADESTTNELSAKEALETLKTTWTQYIEAKRLLQITDMRDLLLLDADIRTQGNAFSSFTGEDFVTIF